ncbi:MAG: 16S rRNA (cytosine(1402)-N(4))-methyltransferase RsmH [Kiritimatiellae bacterium]|nr:16S rRNA (cytosine(1402)-N(4))-methyltransferase RsmH [Kiritimatiellia bacterium]
MHVPVLLSETVEALAPRPGRRYVDGTLGGGGHAEAVLLACGPDGRLLGLDRDGDAVARCRGRLAPFGGRFEAVHSDFARIGEVARERGFAPADGVLLDLGVSSFQLDEPARGFSFRADGPLDMRMDRSRGRTAAELLDSFGGDWRALAAILRDFGEEPAAGRIARAILDEHARSRIDSTARLAAVVEKAAGGRRGAARHPATRTFQALRIAVNGELEQIETALEAALGLLAEDGRLAVITFHSLEDRIVKRAFAAHEGRDVALQQGGSRWEGRLPAVRRLHRRPLVPSPAECAANPRARSAKLRAVRRLPDAQVPTPR